MKREKLESHIDELMFHLIATFRRITHLPGPPDRLQTREFRTVCEQVQLIEKALMNGAPKDFWDREMLAAYLLYHFPLHYQMGLSLLNELNPMPERVVDLGAGLMPFSLAAIKKGAKEVLAADQNAEALRLGAECIGRLGYPITTKAWRYPQALPIQGEVDLIILGFCHREMAETQEAQAELIAKCLQKLSPTGFLLLIDRSETDINREFLKLRTLLGCRYAIQAPCLWQGTCPALESKTPCFAQRQFIKPHLMKEIQRGADIFLNSLKMSYLILRSPKMAPRTINQPYYRVISPSFETHFGKRYYLCGVDGKATLDLPQDKSHYSIERGTVIELDKKTSEFKHIAGVDSPIT